MRSEILNTWGATTWPSSCCNPMNKRISQTALIVKQKELFDQDLQVFNERLRVYAGPDHPHEAQQPRRLISLR